MKLGEIAHCRAGDKGNTSTLAVIPYQVEDYEILKEKLSIEKVSKYFKDYFKGEIKRFEMDNLSSLLFVCEKALESGVTTSKRIDPHGKSLSAVFLNIEID
ncbi:MAG: hypothetical protein RIR51_2174 [Bacteroidota bacterium]|jgi:hypothetical protein